jgi:ABC-type branched-subunit amino acid transport system substrate-binding protein
MSSRHRRWLPIGACLAVAAAVLTVLAGTSGAAAPTATSSASTPGVTATSITLGTHTPLTGPAAPGYSLIAPAADAYFKYVNAHGGVYGRKINLLIKDDAYNPANTVTVVHQLVLQDNVFGIFAGLGSPTHTKVVGFLNAEKVPDMFVASGCPCWDNGKTQPWTFGWQPNYTIEGKILGQYIKQHFKGEKVGVIYQDDDFGNGGLHGLTFELPASQIVSAQPYEVTGTNLAPQVTALKNAGAQIEVDFTVPAFTALTRLAAFTVGYKPTLFVSNVGIDPHTVGGLLSAFSKGSASTSLIEGAYTDGYLPSSSDTTNPWIKLFLKVDAAYDGNVPFDGNVEYGMATAYTMGQALEKAGKNLTRQGLISAVDSGLPQGAGLVPFRYTKAEHGGFGGAQMGQIKNGKIVLFGPTEITVPNSSPITDYTKKQAPPPASGIPN